jgi:hypothetical protein
LVALQAFIGVGALFGGYGLLADAEGLGMEEEWLDGSPQLCRTRWLDRRHTPVICRVFV